MPNSNVTGTQQSVEQKSNGTQVKVAMAVTNSFFTYDFVGYGARRMGYVTVGPFNDNETVVLIVATGDTPEERKKAETCFLRMFMLKAQDVEFFWPTTEPEPKPFEELFAEALMAKGDGPGRTGATMENTAHNNRVISMLHSGLDMMREDYLNSSNRTAKQYMDLIMRLMLESRAALR